MFYGPHQRLFQSWPPRAPTSEAHHRERQAHRAATRTNEAPTQHPWTTKDSAGDTHPATAPGKNGDTPPPGDHAQHTGARLPIRGQHQRPGDDPSHDNNHPPGTPGRTRSRTRQRTHHQDPRPRSLQRGDGATMDPWGARSFPGSPAIMADGPGPPGRDHEKDISHGHDQIDRGHPGTGPRIIHRQSGRNHGAPGNRDGHSRRGSPRGAEMRCHGDTWAGHS
jgi:hypothetical protein